MYKLSAFALLAFLSLQAAAQTLDLDQLLEAENKKADTLPTKAAVQGTFNTTRIANGHSTETLAAGILDVKIQHRFGTINSGLQEFFGIDQAVIRLGLDYGITQKLMVGLGRTSYQKQVDAFAKYQLFRQQTNGTPVTVAGLASFMVRTDDFDNGLPYETNFSDRLSYAFQLMVARKFSNKLSLQFMPTLVHYNIVPKSTDPNDIISLGIGGSYRLSRRVSLTGEYYYNLPGQRFEGTRNSLAIGFDIETGGHVFQLLFTNGQGIAERPFITETTGNFFAGDIHFGFNISRVFQIGGKKKTATTPKS
jgi:hypothetical protein